MSLLIKKSRPPEQKINKGQNRALAVDRLWGLIVGRIWRPYSIWGKRENVLHVSENAISAQKITKNRPTARARFNLFSQKGALAVGRDLS